jgi:hypothetical protein
MIKLCETVLENTLQSQKPSRNCCETKRFRPFSSAIGKDASFVKVRLGFLFAMGMLSEIQLSIKNCQALC